jgi:L-asparaginase II
MKISKYAPIFQTTRGDIVESVHYGAFAIVDAFGNLIAWYGEPNAITFLRSSAKPLQAIPFVESGGVDHFSLSSTELALICASHSGTDEHVKTLASIQQKSRLSESDLLCGVHPPFDKPTVEAMRLREEEPSPNRHNCSGKHTGMLASAVMNGWTTGDYIDQNHPVQKRILKCFADMSNLSLDDISIGIDGCSVPNFAVPLYNAALAYARLCEPSTLDTARANACQTITKAMTSNPEMVSGPDRFDTCLMQVGRGRIVSKGGAEGYQSIGIMPGALSDTSPALGIAIKISDGDQRNRVRPPVSVEILLRLGALNDSDLASLEKFKPISPIQNWRKLVVGYSQPCFELHTQE